MVQEGLVAAPVRAPPGDDTKYLHVYTAGQLMPDFTFVHYDGDDQGKHVVNPTSPIALNELIRPGEGRVSIAACAELVIPPRTTLGKHFRCSPSTLPAQAKSSGTGGPTAHHPTSAAASRPSWPNVDPGCSRSGLNADRQAWSCVGSNSDVIRMRRRV
jgi:hypothetical protein